MPELAYKFFLLGFAELYVLKFTKQNRFSGYPIYILFCIRYLYILFCIRSAKLGYPIRYPIHVWFGYIGRDIRIKVDELLH